MCQHASSSGISVSDFWNEKKGEEAGERHEGRRTRTIEQLLGLIRRAAPPAPRTAEFPKRQAKTFSNWMVVQFESKTRFHIIARMSKTKQQQENQPTGKSSHRKSIPQENHPTGKSPQENHSRGTSSHRKIIPRENHATGKSEQDKYPTGKSSHCYAIN